MLDGKVVLPVVRQALVEGGVLLLGDVLRVARPDGLGLVELLVLNLLLLDLLGLLVLLLLLIVDLLDLGLVFALLLLLLGLLLVFNLLWIMISISKTQGLEEYSVPSRPPWSQRAGWGRR